MTYPPHPEGTPPPADPYAPVDYPANFPPMPPPVYPTPYPQPAGYAGYPYPPPGYSGYPGYPGYGDPYDPYRPTKPPGTNGKAIAALVTSLAGLLFCGLPSIAGIILGIVAMRETKRTGQDGFGLAVAGVAIGSVIVALIVLYIAFVIILAAGAANSPGTY